MATQSILWRWTANKDFSCSSAYRQIMDSGVESEYHRALWKLKVPMKVRIFLWLMMNDKILTHEVLTNRGCAVIQGCVLCSNSREETCDHIMRTCPYSVNFWIGLCAQQSLPRMVGNNPFECWSLGRQKLTGRNKQRWDTTWAAGSWAVWKERNRRTFTQKRKTEYILINEASTDVHNWSLFS